MFGSLRVATRSSLPDLIPLPAPFMIRVDPCNLCNFRCQYCPTAFPELLREVGRPKGMMGFELFKKIVADLGGLAAPLKKLYLYKDGEPLLNKQLPEMIACARAAGVPEVWTTTNGSLLNPDLNRRLVAAGLTTIRISIQGVRSEDYRTLAHVKVDYDALRSQVADLFEHREQLRVYVKIIDFGLSEADRGKFMEDFAPIADVIHIDTPMGWSVSSARDFTLGTNPTTNMEGSPLVAKKVCAFPFYTLSINFDGSASICCADWSHATVVGDVNQETIAEIWGGERLREFRRMHLRGERHLNKACGDCQYIRTIPDNLDAQAAELLDRLGPPAPAPARGGTG